MQNESVCTDFGILRLGVHPSEKLPYTQKCIGFWQGDAGQGFNLQGCLRSPLQTCGFVKVCLGRGRLTLTATEVIYESRDYDSWRQK